MCERVLVLHDGEQMYDGKFKDLIKSINPERRLLFEFSNSPSNGYFEDLKKEFDFTYSDNILTAQLAESELKNLLSKLLNDFSPMSMSFEDLSVEETMRSFFQNPQIYL